MLTTEAYVSQLLTEARDELSRADQKANILLAVVGVATAVIVGALTQIHFVPLSMSVSGQVAFWPGVLAIIVTIILIMSAIYPRTGVGDSSRLHYFGDVAAHLGSTEELVVGLELASGSRMRRDAAQLRTVSDLIVQKFRLIRWAIVLFGLGLGLLGLGLVFA